MCQLSILDWSQGRKEQAGFPPPSRSVVNGADQAGTEKSPWGVPESDTESWGGWVAIQDRWNYSDRMEW